MLFCFLDVELLIKRINLGLNFFGYKPTYVPDRSWKDIQDELHKVLTNAEKESKSVNSILEKIERNSVLSDKFKQVESLNILPFEKELDETKKLIELQQSLKKKTIKVRHNRYLQY